MSEEIIKVIDALAAKLGIAIDWTAANVMPYMQELAERYIGYKIASNIYTIVVWALIAIAACIIFSGFYRKSNNLNGDDFLVCGAITFGIICAILTVVAVVVLFVFTKDIITCIMLPEMVILGYLKGMM